MKIIYELKGIIKKWWYFIFDFALDYNDDLILSSNGNVILKTSNGVTLYTK